MKKRLRLGITLLACSPILTHANIWEELNSMPATQYDVGRIYTDVTALELDKMLKGEKLKGSKYSFKKVASTSLEGGIGFKFSFEARGKYIDPADCNNFAASFKQRFVSSTFIKGIWPNLSAEQYDSLYNNFVFQVELVNTDNSAVMATCVAS